jgi:maltose alpha-D-glucosyltransferase/alpha-amylase
VVNDPVFGYKRVNVADQRHDPQSLLNRTERMIRMRKECPEISWGNFEVLRTSAAEVLAIRYDWRGTSLVTLHNFSAQPRTVKFTAGGERDGLLTDLFSGRSSHALSGGGHRIRLEAYGWRWLRAGGVDDTLMRDSLTSADPGMS